MSKTVKTVDLKPGMRVTKAILGARGDVKVNVGEVLSKLHTDKLQGWNKDGSVDKANPSGIEVSTALGTGDLVPKTIDEPWKSPVIEKGAKDKLRKSMIVTVEFDANGNVVKEEEKPITEEKLKEEEKSNEIIGTTPETKKRGRPKTQPA